LIGCLLALHVVAAPLLLPLRAGQMEVFAAAQARGASGIPQDPSIEGRTVVIVAAPTVLFANYVQAERELLGVSRPEHLYVLASASSPIHVERSGDDALLLRPEHGFLYTPLERHYRGKRPLATGDRVTLSEMTAEIVDASEDGRPLAVRFRLGQGALAPLVLTWKNDRFEPMPMPERGKPVTLPEEDFGKILMEAALHGS
jgi:hypothetical protein